MFYRGVLTSHNSFVYSFGAALLNLDQPWKVIYSDSSYLLSPQTLYECVGDAPHVAFPIEREATALCKATQIFKPYLRKPAKPALSLFHDCPIKQT